MFLHHTNNFCRPYTALSLCALAVGGIALLFASGCSTRSDLFPRYDYRARTNLDYWNAISQNMLEVNAARFSGNTAQMHAIDRSIEQLQKMPTSSIDSEVIAVRNSLIGLLQNSRQYLHDNLNQPYLPDPTSSPGYLHDDEVAMIEQGIRTRIVLTNRYRIEFPQIFSRREELRQQGNSTAVNVYQQPALR